MKRSLILMCLFTFFFFSCKKDSDVLKPVIAISIPNENAHFSVNEKIPVTATVNDESNIEYVVMQIIDENQIAVTAQIISKPNEKKAVISNDIVIENKKLKSGDYYIYIRAFDGANESSVRRNIHISEIAKYSKAIYVVTSPNQNQFSVYKTDSLYNTSLAFSPNGDFIGLQINSSDNQLYTCGSITGNLEALNATNHTMIWNNINNGAGMPFYTAMHHTANVLYVGYYDGHISGYDKNGQIVLNTTAEGNQYYPTKISANNDLIFSEEKQLVGQLKRLSLYYSSTGAIKQSVLFPADVVNMFSKDNDNTFIFANQNGQAKIYIYNILQNSLWEPHTISGTIYAADKMDENTYFISTSNSIYRYRYNTNSLFALLFGTKSQCVKYNATTDEIVTANSKNINVYSNTTMNLTQTIAYSDSIYDIGILYNK